MTKAAAALAVITHIDCLLHDTTAVPYPDGGTIPERPDRLRAIHATLESSFPHITPHTARPATCDLIKQVHSPAYVDRLIALSPSAGYVFADDANETPLTPHTLHAALLSAGAAAQAVDMVASGAAKTVFCATRPPGHHAEYDRAMGFCIFSNAYIAAHYARTVHNIGNIAILDFDVHHGNGTANMFYTHKPQDMLFISSHQHPHWPGTGGLDEGTENGTVLNIPLAAGTTGDAFKRIYDRDVYPALAAFAPELVILSAGFDAYAGDPEGDIKLHAADYADLTTAVKAICPNIISLLEGGYNLDNLQNGVRAHLAALEA